MKNRVSQADDNVVNGHSIWLDFLGDTKLSLAEEVVDWISCEVRIMHHFHSDCAGCSLHFDDQISTRSRNKGERQDLVKLEKVGQCGTNEGFPCDFHLKC
jgi:hypothetical protein